jgi:disulfide bond formation protein DsbB
MPRPSQPQRAPKTAQVIPFSNFRKGTRKSTHSAGASAMSVRPTLLHRWFPRLLREGTPLAASLASIGSAGVSACTGGVCTIAAQAGAGLSGVMAGTGSGLSGVLSLAGNTNSDVPSWLASATPAPTTLPWWLQLLILLLMASTMLTVYGLAGKPRLAVLAGAAGILCVSADLGWIPGGSSGMNAALGLGVPLLVLSPWLPQMRLGPRLRKVLGQGLLLGTIAASVVPLYLQFVSGWHPCLDCWLERGALWSFALLAFFWIRPALRTRPALSLGRTLILSLLLVAGYLVSFLQILEVAHDKAVAALVAVCGAVGPSCAQAGGQLWLGYPIADETITLFGVLLPLLIVLSRPSR